MGGSDIKVYSVLERKTNYGRDGEVNFTSGFFGGGRIRERWEEHETK